MAKVKLTAFLVPKPGMTDKLLAHFDAIIKYSKANEPGTLHYEIDRGTPDRNDGVQHVVARECYASKEAEDIHLNSPPVQAMIADMKTGNLVESAQVVYHDLHAQL